MIQNIQALRALAAIFVVLHHAFPHYLAMGGSFSWLVALGELGFAGVDIFFVISGFVVALTTLDKPRGRASALRFFQNRMARIYLGYWPFLVLAFVLAYLYTPALLQSTSLLRSVLLLEPKGENNFLPVAWSLTYELYFYILCIPLFWCPTKKLAPCVLIFFLLILLRNIFIYQKIFSWGGFLTSHFLLEFCAGFLLCSYREIFLNRRGYFILALVGMVSGVIIGVSHGFVSGPKRIYSFGVAAFCLVWLFLLLDHLKIYQANPVWVSLGDASYTIYLSHILILDVFVFSGCRDFIGHQSPAILALAFLLLIAAILCFSLFYYKAMEGPLYRYIRAGQGTPPG